MKSAKRLLALALAGGMIAGVLTGCSGSSGESSASGDDSAQGEDKLKISVILNTLASEYWGYVEAGAKAYGEEHGIEVNVQGPTSETSYDEQQNMIETTLTTGEYDGMVISAIQADTAKKLVAGSDLPIVSVNTRLDAPESLTFVGTGNEAAAKQGAEAAVKLAKERGWENITAIAITGVQGDPTHTDRLNGFKAGTEEAGGTFLSDEIQYADSVADKAVTPMEAIMQTHPEGVAIIYGTNDDMTMAAARVAQENEAYKNTVFCGFDGIQSACESILEGVETMSVAQDPYGMGYKAVEACVKAINGEKLDDFIDTGCAIITKDNAQEQYDKLKGYLS